MSNRQTKVKQRVSANKDKVLKLSKGDMYLPLDTLIQDRSIYPRRNIVENKVNAYADAIKVGVVFPAIIVESKNERPNNNNSNPSRLQVNAPEQLLRSGG